MGAPRIREYLAHSRRLLSSRRYFAEYPVDGSTLGILAEYPVDGCTLGIFAESPAVGRTLGIHAE